MLELNDRIGVVKGVHASNPKQRKVHESALGVKCVIIDENRPDTYRWLKLQLERTHCEESA